MSSFVDELQLIAEIEAMLRREESDWGYSTWLETQKRELAKSRASAANVDFDTALKEVELEVMARVATSLTKSIRPVFAGLRAVTMEEGGVRCQVCLEEMEKGEEVRAMGCMHRYHHACIFKWLKGKNRSCPLCRYKLQVDQVSSEVDH